MEKLAAATTSKPPAPAPNHHDTLPRFPPKHSSKSSVFFTKNPHSKISDSHLNYLCRKGRLTEAITALDSISQQRDKVRPETFINLLQSCIESNSIRLGRKVHARIDLVEEKTTSLETKLVGMYAKCGSLAEARNLFAEMRARDLYSWSAIIGACSRQNRWKEVVELFYKMVNDGFVPDVFLLPKILKACGNCGDIKAGVLIHSLVVKCGMRSYPFVDNSILAVYAKCGKINLARKFFEGMEKRDRVAWNAMISGYCQSGEIEEAERLLDSMCEVGIEPDLVSWNILINGYNQLGRCELAMELIKKMESSGIKPDVVAWTSMIAGHGRNNRKNEALVLFNEMLLSGIKPNGFTIASAIAACAQLKVLRKGLEFHSLALKMGFADDIIVGNSLIDMYSKCGELEAARWVFDNLEKDVCTWNSMIGGYCQAGCCGKAYELFMRMHKSDVQPNAITWNTMISGYMQNGDEDQAVDLFWRMEKVGKVQRDTASWNSLIAGYLKIGKKDEALSIFRQMQFSCVYANRITILTVLPACASLVALKKVKEIHGCSLRRNQDSVMSIANSLIDTYAKSGKLEYSRTIFDRMSSKDIITMNSLISGYILHGCANAALDIIVEMRKLGHPPDKGTFVNIIRAYSLAGMVDEGKLLFSSMKEDYQIIPELEHYLAMVDLYGRSGRLDEAIEFIQNMPINPEIPVWSALLDACRSQSNFELGIYALECLVELEPQNTLIKQSISEAYRICGKLKDTKKVKWVEKDKKIVKLFGQSWIEMKNTLHSFVTGEQPKSYSDHLFSWIESIASKVNEHVHHDALCIEEEEVEEIVGAHSEKLALAFAFVRSISAPSSIRIVKNLRICRDCHEMAKYITTKYGCEIYLRDSKCLHHFESGSCSCGDYW